MADKEKAKAYNKALEAARKELSVDRKEHPVLERVLCNIFPELSENEDERIRKWIVDFIEVRLPDAAEFEPEYRAALAYLEKQKEQKPAEWSEEKDLPRWKKAVASFGNYTVAPTDSGGLCLLVDGYYIMLSELMKLPGFNV